MRRTVLITGVAGFIGSNLAERLVNSGYSVIGVDNLAYGVREQIPDRVEFHQLDVRDAALNSLTRKADYVFHFAAKNCISDCQADPVETTSVNVLGTVNVLEACRRGGVRRLIYAESSALYEGSTMLPTPETEVKPESFYAISKVCTGLFADGYKRYFDVPTTALRYFCVYGPRQDYRRTVPPVFSAFIIKLLRGERPIIYGSGEKRRDFIHIDDVNDFHLLCIEDVRTTGKVFNIGSGHNYAIKEIFQIISGLLHTNYEPILKPDLQGEAFANLADIGEAVKLGWKPRISLEDGLRTSIDFIKAQLAKGMV